MTNNVELKRFFSLVKKGEDICFYIRLTNNNRVMAVIDWELTEKYNCLDDNEVIINYCDVKQNPKFSIRVNINSIIKSIKDGTWERMSIAEVSSK